MNALICMINAKFIHSSLSPWYLKAGIDEYSMHTKAHVIEGTVNEKPENNIEKLTALNADVIGFSCYIWNIEYVKKIAKTVKEKTNAIIVFGGPEVSFNADSILKECEYVDYVLSGEGEEPFARLCDAIAVNGDIKDIKGICYRSGDGIIINEPYISGKEPPSPYCYEYFDTLGGRIAYIEGSRGCPFACGFCLSGRCGKLVFFDTERTKKELLMLANSSTQTVKFIDRTFNADVKRCNELLSFINDNYGKTIPKGKCFHFEIAGDILVDSTMEIMSHLPKGAVQLEIGLQSFNSETLRAVNRKTNMEKLTANIEKLISFNNMHIHIDLIAGLPFEDLESFKSSFNKAFELRPHMLQLGFLKLIHGSELRQHSDGFKCEYSPAAPYEVRSTDCMSEADLGVIHCAEDGLERMYNSARFLNTLNYIFDRYNADPFELFFGIGKITYGRYNISLDDYTELVYNFLKTKYNDPAIRDKMVTDRLVSSTSGVVPECLKIKDTRLKRVKKYISENIAKSAGKTGCAILYSENRIIYCTYKNRDTLTGNYIPEYIPLNGESL